MKQKIFQILVTILILLITSGCAIIQVKYNIPTTRFISPEAKGKTQKGHIFINQSSAQCIQLLKFTDVYLFGQATDTVTALSGSNTFGGGITFGVAERIDFSVAAFSQMPILFGIKYQFLGEPESANKTGWKGSVAFHYGEAQKTENDDVNGDYYTGFLRAHQTDINLVMGYRFLPQQLLYAT